MSDSIAVKGRRGRTRACRHHWIIETPHGKTSRGHCKRCGTNKRFLNAAEDARWAGKGGMGRWANRKGIAKPTKIHATPSGKRS